MRRALAQAEPQADLAHPEHRCEREQHLRRDDEVLAAGGVEQRLRQPVADDTVTREVSERIAGLHRLAKARDHLDALAGPVGVDEAARMRQVVDEHRRMQCAERQREPPGRSAKRGNNDQSLRESGHTRWLCEAGCPTEVAPAAAAP